MNDKKWYRYKKNTLLFYKNKLPYKAKQFNFIFPLHSYFEEMIGNKKEVFIADFGAGLFSTTGSTWNGVNIQLYPSDILADEFRLLLKDASVVPIIPVEKQDMVELTYQDNFFDIVHCVNALDHCANPLKALKEMYRICKIEGWIYLKHFYNNAEYERYKGFHQWNICKTKNDDCLIWGKENKILLSDYFDKFNIDIETDSNDREIIIIKILKE